MSADPTTVDSNHYKVEFENDRVRVLRISYGPGEKSEMHAHPASVGVFLTDLNGRFTYPDGSTEEIQVKAGDAGWFEAVEHLPENLSDESLEAILIESRRESSAR